MRTRLISAILTAPLVILILVAIGRLLLTDTVQGAIFLSILSAGAAAVVFVFGEVKNGK